MERKTLKEFYRNLTWQSRFPTLVVIAAVIFAQVFNAGVTIGRQPSPA